MCEGGRQGGREVKRRSEREREGGEQSEVHKWYTNKMHQLAHTTQLYLHTCMIDFIIIIIIILISGGW